MGEIVHVPAQVRPAFQDQDFPPAIGKDAADGSAREARADNQVIDGDHNAAQQAPLPVNTTPTVRPRILTSRPRLNRAMYSKSWDIMDNALVLLARSRICHKPVIPGRTSARVRRNSGYGSSIKASNGRGPIR